ncbi:unnamed protein product [Caenorhabditis auriculariae]|uniref:tRNA(Phe) (4-demethylwyosine(37)-C(7)) aminocarboxypropyltransferase n=1 Tax=Caenorhabditis auriculariae TaxID=2777116 RepID=A0A8S1HEI1_9PELO|nr:unnamed protein product [Caenorhabditis auriculariae]
MSVMASSRQVQRKPSFNSSEPRSREGSAAPLVKASPFGQMLEDVRKLALSKSLWDDEMQRDLPKKWEKHGDLIIFPQNCFTHTNWRFIGRELWGVVAKSLKVARLGRKRQIDEMRTPHVDLLYGNDGWVEHVDERGVRYLYDASKRVYNNSKNNEMKRISKWACQGQTVVDMYAGLGYYSMTFLVVCEAKNLVAVDWDEEILDALVRSAQTNHVEDRIVVIHGDARRVTPTMVADRVYLGLLPSCRAHWLTACKALKPEGGVIHINDILDSTAPIVIRKPERVVRQTTLPSLPSVDEEKNPTLEEVEKTVENPAEDQKTDASEAPAGPSTAPLEGEAGEQRQKRKFSRSASIVEEMEKRVLPTAKVWKEYEENGWNNLKDFHKEYSMECAQNCIRFLNNIHLSDAMYGVSILNLTRYGEVSSKKEHVVLDLLCYPQDASVEHMASKFTTTNLSA